MNIYLSNTYYKTIFIIFIIICGTSKIYSKDSLYTRHTLISNNDSLKILDSMHTEWKYILFLDSLKPVISNVFISGNDITLDEIILREMKLKKGMIFSSASLNEDKENIYGLGLFVHVNIQPKLREQKNVDLYVDVQEKWYIFPSLFISFTDGDIKKWTAGISTRWQNFRGRNESVSLAFG